MGVIKEGEKPRQMRLTGGALKALMWLETVCKALELCRSPRQRVGDGQIENADKGIYIWDWDSSMRYLVLGAIDGIITAGTLSASLLIKGGELSVDLALSIAVVVATINASTAFVAEYSHQMREVRETTYKLLLREEERGWTLLHTRALYATAKSALLIFASSFVGALAVLIPAHFTPHATVAAVAAAVVVTSLVLAGGSWREFLELATMIALAVTVGVAVGIVFPLIT